MTFPIKVIILLLTSAVLAALTRRSLGSLRCHGPYRLLAWIAFIALVLINIEVWFHEPWSLHQLLSWVLLVLSLFVVAYGIVSLRRGRVRGDRSDATLIGIEKTSVLVETGAYRYIRHPIYGSLLLGGLGVLLKNVTLPGCLVTACLFIGAVLAARMEERENIAYFGERYRDYMKRTRMFVPFVC